MLEGIFISSVVSAALFTGTLGDTTVDFSHDKYRSTLKLMSGKCLRSKRVVFVNVKVYETYVHVANLDTLKRTKEDVLDSLAEQKSVAIRLKLLRDIEAERIRGSFEEALKANKVDTSTPEMQNFFNIVREAGEAKEGQTVSLIGFKGDTEESLVVETPQGAVHVVKGPVGFLKNIYSIWFGTTTEKAMEDLKSCLIKG